MSAAAIGFNVETVSYKNIKFQVWDLGGQTSIRPYWRCACRAGLQKVKRLLISSSAAAVIWLCAGAQGDVLAISSAAMQRSHTSCTSLHSRAAMQAHHASTPSAWRAGACMCPSSIS